MKNTEEISQGSKVPTNLNHALPEWKLEELPLQSIAQ
jgi:hypothetical protein